MEKIVFITGATAGIGEACAYKYAENGFKLILSARRKEKLEKLAHELNQKYKAAVLPLVLDVRDRDAVKAVVSGLPDEWQDIDILVNNAGLALGLNPIHEGLEDDWDTMIDTNIKGLLYMARAIAPGMVKRGEGHIINIGSIAGKEVYPKGNVYSATKHAVDALTKGMRLDLVEHGIRVSQVAPGAVETEFSMVRFKGDHDRAGKVYKGYTPLLAEDIAEAVYFVSSLPPRVNVNDIVVMPADQANATTFHKKQ